MDSKFYFKNNSHKSFTLIELLVVIAIIGLLASVVLVSTQGLQTKAKLTKTLEFSQTLNNALGAYAVGSWSFDEGSGTSALDASGYGNDGTISGATYNADTPHAAIGRGTGKYALSFDGVNDYVEVLDSSSLDITGALTLEAWIKANSFDCGVYQCQVIDKFYTAYHLRVMTPANNLTLQFFVNSGSILVNGNTSLSTGVWYHVVAVFKPNEYLKVYLNGREDGAKTTGVPSSTNLTNQSVFIGRRAELAVGYFNGLIDEARIYETALTLGQIQQLYAAGLERHQDLAIK